MATVRFHNLPYSEVADLQIIKALNKNIGFVFVRDKLYKMQQRVANEARERGLLFNPGPHDRTQLRAGTSSMVPREQSWEMIKGIQSRVYALTFDRNPQWA